MDEIGIQTVSCPISLPIPSITCSKHVTHNLNHKFAEIALYVTTKPMCIKKENYPYLIVRVHYLFIGVRAGVKHDDCNVISTYH